MAVPPLQQKSLAGVTTSPPSHAQLPSAAAIDTRFNLVTTVFVVAP